MHNSGLITYTALSPNRNPRDHAIDTVTIHCYVGQVTAKQGCDHFAKASAGASANYVVGWDGSIGLSVPEDCRAWTTGGSYTVNGISGKQNDHRAVTIEVASDTTHPYAVTDGAYQALVKLVADIARRNGLGTLKWKGDKSLVGKPGEQNMTVHRWFANKACPGDYLYDRMGDIAEKANALNGAGVSTAPEEAAAWAAEAWDRAYQAGILDGTRPFDPVTRQEMAVILHRTGLLKGGG